MRDEIMEEDKEYLKKLVRVRLAAMPPNVSFSIGNYGDFTPQQLIEEVNKDSEVGQATIDMQISFIRKMPRLAAIASRSK